MTDLKVFKSTEFGELGVMTVNGKEYFPATRCAKILGYKEPEKAIREKCKRVSKLDTPTAGGIQQVNYIPEGDLYRLIVSSKLPAAEKFEGWVFDEVLPSIRQTGGYGQSADLEKIISQTAAAVAAEIVKHISPLISQERYQYEPELIWEEPIPKKRKPTGIVHKLSPEIRNVVDDMLLSGCSYVEVQSYLAKNSIGISQAALCRYYNRYLSR